MSGASRFFLACSNLVIFIISLPIIGIGILFRYYVKTGCTDYLDGPILAVGIFLFVVSLVGMIGSCCRSTSMLWLYQSVMFLLILGLLSFTVLAVKVMHVNRNENGFEEGSRLQALSRWLQVNVVDRQSWDGLRTCLSESNLCGSTGNSDVAFLPIENGCCKPPAHCGYELKNGTVWTVPSSGLASEDHDCVTWSSDPDTLCYDCDSCKAGYVRRMKNDWRRILTFYICLIAFLFINFSIGCCAFKRHRDSYQYQRYYK